MEAQKTSVFANGLIWFGAAVSIAEIMTGTFIAPLGFKNGLAAILLGHLIGCVLFYFAGLIGAKTSLSAMETVKISFGQRGSLLFSLLNVLQLVGWTAIMIIIGAQSAKLIWSPGDSWIWSLIIGALILVWVLVGVRNLSKLNLFAMGGLLILSIVLNIIIFRSGTPLPLTGNSASDGITFGQAVELSAAMPLSWLPLVSDYTRFAAKKKAASLASAGVYFLTSSWMYLIGLGAALFAASSDVAQIMLQAGLGIAGLLIIIFSTVTTAFLDVFSAGVSMLSSLRSFGLPDKFSEKILSVAVCILGTVLAVFTPAAQFESFLYLIGSVFAPMISILIVDVFLLKKDASNKPFSIPNLLIWAVGFAIYRLSMSMDTPVGNTLPVMVITGLLCLIVNKIGGLKRC